MLPGLDHLVDRWRADPRPAATLALCQAVAEHGEEKRRSAHKNLEEWQAFLDVCAEVSAVAVEVFSDDIDILLSLARMHLAAGSLYESQEVLIRALKRAPNDPTAFRLLGEALLRRGDANRALKAIGKAVQLGLRDPRTQIWLDRARFYVDMQEARGVEAVAEEMRRVLGYAATLPVSTSPRMTLPPGTLADAPTAPISVPPPTSRNAESTRRVPGRSAHVPTLMGIQSVHQDAIRSAAAGLSAAQRRELAGEADEPSADAPTMQRMLPDEELPTRKRDISEFQEQLGLGPPRPPAPSDPFESEGPTLHRPAAVPPTDDSLDEATTQVAGDDGPDSLVRVLERAASGALRAASLPAIERLPPPDEYEPETRVNPAPSLPAAQEDPVTHPGIVPHAHVQAAVTKTERLPATPARPQDALPGPPSVDPATARRLVGLLEDSVASRPDGRAHELPVTRIEPPIERMRAQPRAPEGSGIAPEPIAPAPVSAPPPARRRPTRRRPGLILLAVLFFSIGVAIGVVAWRHRAKQHDALTADRLAAEAESLVTEGGEAALEAASQKLVDARALAAERPDVVSAYLRLATVELLDYRGDEKSAVAVVDEARRLGARGPVLSAVSLAAATVIQNQNLSAGLLEDHDAATENLSDPYYQLAAGAVLELRGDRAARARYERALELMPDLHSARHRLARLLILSGEVEAGQLAMDGLGETRPVDRDLLTALAVSISSGGPADGAEPAFPADRVADLPRTLRALGTWLAAPATVASEIAAALPQERSPFVARYLAERALEKGQLELAQASIERALALAPSMPEVRIVAARVALARGRAIDAVLAIEGVDSTEATTLRGVAAYEQCDRAGLDEAVSRLGDGVPPTLRVALARLAGERPIPDAKLETLPPGELWMSVVAIDALLDRGERDRVEQRLARAPNPVETSAHGLRAARLRRETGDVEAAKSALPKTAQGRASLRESLFLQVAAEGQLSDEALDAIGAEAGPEGPWLRAYALVRRGDEDTARALVRELELPEDADLELRVTAALALGELGEVRRGRAVAGPLLEAFPRRFDAVRAGILLGLLPPSALPSTKRDSDKSD